MSAVVGQVRAFQDSFYVLHSSPGVLDHLLQLAERVQVAGKQIHDANIVATMLAYDISDLLTHNTADFVRHSDWITAIPL